MTDLPPLPDLHQALLDRATCERLFADLAACTEIVEVRVKGGAETRAHAAQPGLAEARDLLLSGGVRGVQVRYRYQGSTWCDTLIVLGEGFRVVRIDEAGIRC